MRSCKDQHPAERDCLMVVAERVARRFDRPAEAKKMMIRWDVDTESEAAIRETMHRLKRLANEPGVN
jgi:hypothetical protein